MNFQSWLRRNNRKIVHPLEVVEVIGRTHRIPCAKYHCLEVQGIISPRSYKNGEITSVEIRSNKGDNIEYIAHTHKIKIERIDNELERMDCEKGLPYIDSNLPLDVINDLISNGYCTVNDQERINIRARGQTRLASIRKPSKTI